MNLLNATPTEYVWKYNPLSGIPAGAQQNYGATIDWVLPGGLPMAYAAEEIRARTLPPDVTRAITARFDAESDQQPFAGPRETRVIAANALDSGPAPLAVYPLDFHGRQRVQLAGGACHRGLRGGRTEGRTQLAGGRTEGRLQLAGGLSDPGGLSSGQRYGSPYSVPPRAAGVVLSGNPRVPRAERTADAYKYFLRTEGPSQVVDEPGVYSREQFMTTFLPAVVRHPFDSQDPGSFPAQYSALYKGRTAFEDVFWDWN
ncbi:capsid protein precursor pVIII [Pigeon adenovirus 1]|uniref:Pre-hexon-linking protein VIII n=1 Tax=Pigeon adenovirus 1 TaxID=764030 RepID=X5LRM8_9ADEN|nr:capsid protein precursor pVIII [Pigeon adenovirus 1]QUS52958.1 capsid protein precursor pVIII [Pigeon adenovirus 1]CDO33909.1 capsid protein precursor pVIII [Pigeon adenovirus 1]